MTNPLIRLVFGIQMLDSKETRLVVTGSLGSPAPPLLGVRRHDSWTFSQAYSNGTWEIELDPGDYIIKIEVEEWTAGVIHVETPLDEGQDPPRFVFWGILPETEAEGLAGWLGDETVVDPPDTSTIGNPKDPWPPPPPPSSRTAPSTQAAVSWFSDELETLFGQTSTDQRAGAPGSGGAPPPRRRVG